FAVLMRHLDVLVNLELEDEGTALIDRIVARAEELDLPEVVAASRLHEARRLSRADPGQQPDGAAGDRHRPRGSRLPPAACAAAAGNPRAQSRGRAGSPRVLRSEE